MVTFYLDKVAKNYLEKRGSHLDIGVYPVRECFAACRGVHRPYEYGV